jgi:hypothetical protein
MAAIDVGRDGCAVAWSVGPFLERCFIESRPFSRVGKKRGPLGRVLLEGCCQSGVAGNDRPGQGDKDGLGKHAEGLQKLCVCVYCVFEWGDKEMANELPDLSYTLC